MVGGIIATTQSCRSMLDNSSLRFYKSRYWLIFRDFSEISSTDSILKPTVGFNSMTLINSDSLRTMEATRRTESGTATSLPAPERYKEAFDGGSHHGIRGKGIVAVGSRASTWHS